MRRTFASMMTEMCMNMMMCMRSFAARFDSHLLTAFRG